MAVEVGDIPDAGAVVAVVAAVAMAMAAIVGRRRRNSGYFIRVVTFVQLIASLRDAAEFKSMYRLTYEEFTQLHADICRSDPSYVGDPTKRCTESEMKLLSALRFVAGGDAKDVAKSHGQSKASFWKHLKQTLKVIVAAVPLVMPLDDAAALKELERCCCCGRSFGRGAYRGCIGYLDGLIMPMEKPDLDNAGDFRCNRKDCYAINCQGICDGRLRFTHFSAVCTGGTHDSAAFACTLLGQRVEKGHATGGIPYPYYFGGDSAYKNGEALVVPVPGAERRSESDNFNYVHSQFRSTIERAFGVFIRRFGVFWRPLRYGMDVNLLIIRAAVRLHNICMSRPANAGENIGPLASASEQAQQPSVEQVRQRYLDAYPDPLNLEKSTGSVSRDALIYHIKKAKILRP